MKKIQKLSARIKGHKMKVITRVFFGLIFSNILLLGGFCISGFAQKETAVEEESKSVQGLKPLAEETVQNLEEPGQKIVTAIEVAGNKSISTNTVISKMKTKIGSLYLENVVSDDIKRLYLLGYFSEINVEAQDYEQGIKLIIKVAERPLIEKISFEGIKHLYMKDEKLKELIGLKSKEKEYLDYSPSLPVSGAVGWTRRITSP